VCLCGLLVTLTVVGLAVVSFIFWELDDTSPCVLESELPDISLVSKSAQDPICSRPPECFKLFHGSTAFLTVRYCHYDLPYWPQSQLSECDLQFSSCQQFAQGLLICHFSARRPTTEGHLLISFPVTWPYKVHLWYCPTLYCLSTATFVIFVQLTA